MEWVLVYIGNIGTKRYNVLNIFFLDLSYDNYEAEAFEMRASAVWMENYVFLVLYAYII